jgi:hypothetical protein
MGTTSNRSWPYPESSDFVADGATAIENLADAIDASIGKGYSFVERVYFTSSGTFTKASYPYLSVVRIVVVAAGGGGGRGQTALSAGAGGGSGAYCEQWLAASALGASETVTIGAGGAGIGGGGSGIDGIAGGTSSFGSLISCSGGDGGLGSIDSTSRVVSGGQGGAVTASGSYVGIGGNRGHYGITNAGGYGWPGFGGSTPLGNGGTNSNSAPQVGDNGLGYGAGGGGGLGSGASINRNGGTGANGIVILDLYA